VYWLFIIPAAVLIIVFAVVLFIHNEVKEDRDPEDLVSKSGQIQYAIGTDVESVMILLDDKQYKVLRMSTFKGKIRQHTRVLIVKYDVGTKSYKVERYE